MLGIKVRDLFDGRIWQAEEGRVTQGFLPEVDSLLVAVLFLPRGTSSSTGRQVFAHFIYVVLEVAFVLVVIFGFAEPEVLIRDDER